VNAYILITLLAWNNIGAINGIEFFNLKSCEAAKQLLLLKSGDKNQMAIIECVKK
jgi:hypothetical protein